MLNFIVLGDEKCHKRRIKVCTLQWVSIPFRKRSLSKDFNSLNLAPTQWRRRPRKVNNRVNKSCENRFLNSKKLKSSESPVVSFESKLHIKGKSESISNLYLLLKECGKAGILAGLSRMKIKVSLIARPFKSLKSTKSVSVSTRSFKKVRGPLQGGPQVKVRTSLSARPLKSTKSNSTQSLKKVWCPLKGWTQATKPTKVKNSDQLCAELLGHRLIISHLGETNATCLNSSFEVTERHLVQKKAGSHGSVTLNLLQSKNLSLSCGDHTTTGAKSYVLLNTLKLKLNYPRSNPPSNQPYFQARISSMTGDQKGRIILLGLLRSGNVEPNPGPAQHRGKEESTVMVTTYNVRGLNDERKLRHLVNCCYQKIAQNRDKDLFFCF